jgi:hypothetical protein
MQREREVESSQQLAGDRGADSSAPRSTPLTLVSGAVAGDDLESVGAAVAEALGTTVAIAIPALGEPVVCPPGSLGAEQLAAIVGHAAAVIGGGAPSQPAVIADAVPVRIGEELVGIVAAAASSEPQDLAGIVPGTESSTPSPSAQERRAWLDAAAAAASVTAVLRGGQDAEDSGLALLQELSIGRPEDLPALLLRARRLGFELGAGAIAICAQRAGSENGQHADELSAEHGALLAESGDGRILGLAPIGSPAPDELVSSLRRRGMTVALAAPRRNPGALHEALHEAELLVELGIAPDVQLAAHDETYRLLIGVLLRDPDELARLRDRTITPLVEYDTQHDTELLATLRAFLVHDGSTTETADAMHLHRHTVGYRLSRVHEVSSLSPYESDGRERLSLGLKAHQILDAELRRATARDFSTRELTQ